MTKTKILFFCFVLLFILLLGCGTAGHAGLESGTGYSDLDNSDMERMTDYWEAQNATEGER